MPYWAITRAGITVRSWEGPEEGLSPHLAAITSDRGDLLWKGDERPLEWKRYKIYHSNEMGIFSWKDLSRRLGSETPLW